MPGSLQGIYAALRQHFGSLYGDLAATVWWPIFSDNPPFEIVVGAVLVQQTRWETVEGAILRLHDAGLLAPCTMAQAIRAQVAELLRPVAFHTQKAPGLIAIGAHLCTAYNGDLLALLARPTPAVRRELLALPRIGPETADVIMLYAGQHPVFVVDEYTRRLFGRIAPDLTRTTPIDWRQVRYAVMQSGIEQELHTVAPPHAVAIFYADYHALINEQCVRYCLVRPQCDGPPARRVYSRQDGRQSYLNRTDGCPLRDICAFYQEQQEA